MLQRCAGTLINSRFPNRHCLLKEGVNAKNKSRFSVIHKKSHHQLFRLMALFFHTITNSTTALVTCVMQTVNFISFAHQHDNWPSTREGNAQKRKGFFV